MSRLAIVLGLSGFISGCFFSYGDAQTLWNARTAYRRFESLMALTTMQKVAKAARDDANSRTKGYLPQATTHGHVSKYGGIPVDDESEAAPQGAHMPRSTDPWEAAAKEYKQEEFAGFTGLINLDGIKQVTVDKVGVVSSIELSTGESVQRVAPPALKAYLIPLLYPVLGFLIPWGGIRLLTWVGSGFVEPRR